MATATEERAMAKVDALAHFIEATQGLSPRMEAIGKLATHMIELDQWGRTMRLQIHNLGRERFDAFDAREDHYPPTEDRDHEFWSKTVILNEGDYTPDDGPEGNILLTLYTKEAPAA